VSGVTTAAAPAVATLAPAPAPAAASAAAAAAARVMRGVAAVRRRLPGAVALAPGIVLLTCTRASLCAVCATAAAAGGSIATDPLRSRHGRQ